MHVCDVKSMADLVCASTCRVAKVLGDRRADVAARSFGKPLSRVLIESIDCS